MVLQHISRIGLWALACIGLALVCALILYVMGRPSQVPVLRKDITVPVAERQLLLSDNAPPTLKVAIGAMISPKDTEVYYTQLLQYLGKAAEMRVELVQRKTYAEINKLLVSGDIDLAFICSGPYALSTEKQAFYLLSTPQVQGRPSYQSYLIVHQDSPANSLEDLRGKSFAFTDPDSNTGTLVPRYWLQEAGLKPSEFFKETIFTYSHDNSIFAVVKGLVDGAAVDSLIWDFYAHKQPDLTAKTRIIRRSEPYGIPPVVASHVMADAQRTKLQGILLKMHENTQGKSILQALLIDRFVLPEDDWYSSIRFMQQALHSGQGAP